MPCLSITSKITFVIMLKRHFKRLEVTRIFTASFTMMLTNFTEDENQRTYNHLFCSTELTGAVHYQLICLGVLNILLSITAFLGNALILFAFHKESSLHSPTKLLFRCLATSDFCVGIFSEPLIVVYWLSVVKENWNMCRYALASSIITSMILCSVSLLTLTAISVDRLLALLLGIRYRQVVTLRRTYLIVTVIWTVSIVGAMMYLWSYLITLWYRYIGILLCLVISIVAYGKVFLTLRQRQTQLHDRVHKDPPSQTGPINIARYKKAVSTALWLQLILVCCYLPFGIGDALITQRTLSPSLYVVREFMATLIFLNSSLNPILYCWKISGVREAVKNTIRQLWCSPN